MSFLGNAIDLKIETDEDGFEIHLTTYDGSEYVINVQSVVNDLVRQVDSEVRPWYREAQSFSRLRRNEEDGS